MSSQGLIIKSDITSIIPKGKVWGTQKRQKFPFTSDEEKLFNLAHVELIQGIKCRVTTVTYTQEDLLISIGELVNRNTLMINEFLKRAINSKAPFPGYKNGKVAISTLTQQFREQLSNTLSPGKIGYNLLQSEEVYTIMCDIVASGPEPSTYEGTCYIEFKWYAELLKQGQRKCRPIVHVYNSRVKK